MSLRLAMISSSSSVSRLPMPSSFSTRPTLPAQEADDDRGSAGLPGRSSAARHGEFGAVDLLAAEEVGDGFDGGLLVIEIGLEVQLHRTLLTGCERRMTVLLRIAAMLVLAMSSAKA